MSGLTRRDFFTWVALGVPAAFADVRRAEGSRSQGEALPGISAPAGSPKELDLSPAAWIWYPSGRTLPNTFVLFRKEFTIEHPVKRASGWICADSRYLLFANGDRIQWGPAASDPRWMEVDPVDITTALRTGTNVIGATALYYGHGDGTSPAGKPGFIVRLEIETTDGAVIRIVSDESWRCTIPRSWRPGHYKRWYVRSLQEEFDGRLYPSGWTRPGFIPGAPWRPAMILPGSSADATPISSAYNEYALDYRGDPSRCALSPRSIPLMRETLIPARTLRSSFFVAWNGSPEEYFESLTPGAYTPDGRPAATGNGGRGWTVVLEEGKGSVLTFELEEEAVGWPMIGLDAPAGTTVELMVQEHHDPSQPALLNTHYHSWTRFICAEGLNRFETFDYEAVKWMQIHIRGGPGTVTVRDVGLRRRTYAWDHLPDAATSDAAINRLISASVNTVNNSVHELAVDGMGRERQQYSGDGSHQLHAVYLGFGETRQPARFLKTFSQGMTEEGFFLDCWPAYDRLARLWERQIGVSYWGPLLDHGIGFVFDCMHHYLYTGDRQALAEPFPRLLKFFTYLRTLRREDGLLGVEGLGVPSVYIDHLAYKKQRHKQCAFNLYAAAMLRHALAPLAEAFGELAWKDESLRVAGEILLRTQESFWDKEEGMYVANLPWAREEGESRTCDRSLSLGILYDLCPGGKTGPALERLAEAPPSMGFSYPANSCWRLWALAKGGRPDAILHDLRTRWTLMDSVNANNTLQEFWTERPDAGSVMSHCCPVPLYIMYMGIAGIQPLAPGFTRCMVRPQPGDLEHIALTARTVRGNIVFAADGRRGDRRLSVTMPAGCTGELTLDARESLDLEPWPSGPEPGLRRYVLTPGKTTEARLHFT